MQNFAEESITSKLDSDVKPLETPHQVHGLFERTGIEGKPVELLEIKTQALLE